MRTNSLLKKAMRATGMKTNKATVEEALKRVVRQATQLDAFEKLRGDRGGRATSMRCAVILPIGKRLRIVIDTLRVDQPVPR